MRKAVGHLMCLNMSIEMCVDMCVGMCVDIGIMRRGVGDAMAMCMGRTQCDGAVEPCPSIGGPIESQCSSGPSQCHGTTGNATGQP